MRSVIKETGTEFNELGEGTDILTVGSNPEPPVLILMNLKL